MKSTGSANPRDRIRLQVVGLAALAVILIATAIVFTRSHSRIPEQVPVEKPTVVITSNPPRETRNAASRPAEPHHSQPESEPETTRLISTMLDNSASLQLRRQAAHSLGKIGTVEAMVALKSALTNGAPPYVKAAIAEGLGESPNPESRDLLHELASGKDEATARAAARGLAARGDADAVDTLGNLLFNDQTPMSVRTEAALALGDVSLPAAQDTLTRAISQIHDEDVVESVLDGLGRRPFSETEGFFGNYLNSPDVPPASKVLAIEAVRDAEGDVGPFLSKYLNDANPDVRAAAKEALDFLKP